MLSSRRFIIALVALTSLTILGIMSKGDVATSIAAVSIGLAGANAAQGVVSSVRQKAIKKS